MELSIYVALSGQLTLEKRMSTLAGNIANANTPGFKAAGLGFGTLLANSGKDVTAFANLSSNTLDMSIGPMTRTDNALDLAIRGSASFSYRSTQATYFSRDGRLTITPDGKLQNLQGDSLLDSANSPVLIDPKAGNVSVGQDGKIFQHGAVVGQVGLYAVDTSKGFTRHGTAGFVPVIRPEPLEDFSQNGVLQGYVEGSNVNAVGEMVNLIDVTRAFEAMSTFADKALEAERNAIETLGSR
jgi:flagellar basal-body rod protein FlgF